MADIILTPSGTGCPLLSTLTVVGSGHYGEDFNEFGQNVVSLYSNDVSASNQNSCGLVKSATKPFTFIAGFDFYHTIKNYQSVGICIRDSSTNRITYMFYGYSSAYNLKVVEYPDEISAAFATKYTGAINIRTVGRIYFKVYYEADDTIAWYASPDGLYWIEVSTYTNTYLANVDQVGIMVNPQTSANDIGVGMSVFYWSLS